MSVDEDAELHGALKVLQDAHKTQGAHRAAAALERALLMAPAAALATSRDTVAAAVRLLQPADDNGTTRLEVRDQAITRRRWFAVDVNGETTWDNR